ncbi:citramalate synthase [Truepera radiovictrix]|nr:citramalate synthase [Truepera radiovictrix]WMT58089.1 citramalate synthase [Truepera radiovictrix]
MTAVEIYDTTLRDGTQGTGFSLTSEDKVAIARRLDAFGVDVIEGGWPGSNPKDARFFELMRGVALTRARLAAFGSTRRKGVRPEEDANLQALLAADTPVVTIFGKSWTLHVREALAVSLEENLAMIRDSVAFLRAQGREVFYDAEHFFDGYRADAAYALATLEAACEAGASRLVLCDTNGGSLPEWVHERTAEVCARFAVPVGIHPHNDAELAVANALAALRSGARQVQGTIGGYGERCGNLNLVSLLPTLKLKLGFAQPQDLSGLRELARYVDERANMPPNVRAPYVGDAAFAHKGGVHVSAVAKNPETYEHIPPEAVGNRRQVLLSDLSGRANVLAKSAPGDGAPEAAAAILARLKELEHRGYAFEGAEASFHLMSLKVRGRYRPYFTLHGYRVTLDKRDGDAEPLCEASVRVEVAGQLEHTAAAGHGPVNALDRALGKALGRFYPSLAQLRLTDYKVRVLSGAETGTASVVRVQVETTDGADTWGTVGASSDIIDASYSALIDAIEYKLHKDAVTPQADLEGRAAGVSAEVVA